MTLGLSELAVLAAVGLPLLALGIGLVVAVWRFTRARRDNS